MSPQEAAGNALALSKFTPNAQLSQAITAAQAGSPPALDSRFFNYTVWDSLPNILANLAGINALAQSGQLAKLRFTEAAPDIAVTAAQLGQLVYPLTFAFEIIRTITLTDTGTPAVTINADVLSNVNVRNLLNQVPNTFRLNVSGWVSTSVAASILGENNAVLGSLTGLKVMDTASNIVGNLASLETLARSGRLARINFLDGGVPNLNLSVSQISSSGDALGLIFHTSHQRRAGIGNIRYVHRRRRDIRATRDLGGDGGIGHARRHHPDRSRDTHFAPECE